MDKMIPAVGEVRRTPIRDIAWLAVLVFISVLAACGGGGDGAAGPDSGDDTGPQTPPDPDDDPPLFEGLNVVNFPMGPVTPANADSQHADVLQDCVFSNERVEPCTLETLPLLGQDTRDPGVDDVLDRVVVSHDWMGPRMREIIEAMPGDVRLLMRGVTAVVVSDDIRPSFYWTATGAIYIDSDYIWTTPEECADTPDFPDFRQDFGDELLFIMPARYVKDGGPAFPQRNPDSVCDQFRPLEQVLPNIGRLLYHELAHANDFFPPERQANAGTGQPSQSIMTPTVSDELASTFPLTSTLMHDLAEVRFGGRTPTAAEREVTPEEVADAFPPDGAIHFYGYTTEREYLAMSFEFLMLRFHFGIEVDHGVVNNANHPQDPRSDFIVAWGQRNRLGDAEVRERARLAASRLLPERADELDAYVDSLPAPRMMTVGRRWQDMAFDDDPDATLLRDLNGDVIDLRRDPRPLQDLPPYH